MTISLDVGVTILTPCRDAMPYLAAYRRQVTALTWPADRLRVIFVEGDSVDDTPAQLAAWAAEDDRVRIVTCNTSAPRYGSVVNAERFSTLATVFNAGLDAVDWGTHVLKLPVDIGYQPDMLTRLLAHDVDLVSPFTWLGSIFYDVFAMARNGAYFTNFWRTTDMGTDLLEMDSIGGTLLMRAEVLRAGCRYAVEDVDRGLCRMARAAGFRLWADPTTHIEHGLL